MKPKSELILYQTEDNRTLIEVRLENETVWLSLNQLAELFQRDKSVISKHIRNVFEEGELQPEATVAKYATVQTEGARTVSREIEFYNLDVKNPHTVDDTNRDPAELLAEYQNAQAAVAEVREKLRRELETALTR